MKPPRSALIGFALVLFVASQAQAFANIPPAYRSAAENIPVNPTVFYALAILESGQSERTPGYRPWPWTLTVDKKPYYFDTRVAAETFLKQALKSRPAQLGIGLFQIEHRFHAHRFPGIGSMLDPYENTRVAAEIFREALDQEDGDVWKAVGRFHSATPQYAQAYQRRFGIALLQLIGDVS